MSSLLCLGCCFHITFSVLDCDVQLVDWGGAVSFYLDQNVDFPVGGGLQDFLPGQSSSTSSSSPAGVHESADERGAGALRTFPCGKKCGGCLDTSAHGTLAACEQPRGSVEEDELLAGPTQLRTPAQWARLRELIGASSQARRRKRKKRRKRRLIRPSRQLRRRGFTSVAACGSSSVTALCQFRIGLCYSPGLCGEGGYIYVDMSEHTCGVAFDATLPEVEIPQLPFINIIVVFPVMAQRQPPVAVHSVVDVPVVFFNIPVVTQSPFPMVQTVQRTMETSQLPVDKVVHVPC